MTWRRVVQLALVHVGVSITVVPVTSTLNRIMIADMKMSAFLVSFLVALPYLLSPLQVAIGNWADRNPIWGMYRSPWILIGGLMASFGSYLTAHAAYLMYDQFGIGLAASIGAFILWGLGVNMASVSYLSLVSDLTSDNEGWRSRAVSVMWTAMILSTIIVSLALSRMLETTEVGIIDSQLIFTAFGVVWFIATIFIFSGSAGLEPKRVQDIQPQNSADNPIAAFQLLAKNASARRFFIYLVLVLVSIHAQDVLLEPFAADTLNMSVSATARLTSIWGLGVFITLLGGLLAIRRFGKKQCANAGAGIAALGFGLIILTGLLGQPNLFMGAVFLLGLGGGLMTISNLSFMLDMTVASAAGLYIGAWGVANFVGQAIGNIISGLLRDIILALTGSLTAGYVSVFALEIVGLLVAIWMFQRISVTTFRRDADIQMADMLAIASD